MADTPRIAIATFGRSDFSILRTLATKFYKAPDFEVGWWVGGAHFEDLTGQAIQDIERTGVPIWARIETPAPDRTALGTVMNMADQLAGFGQAAFRGGSARADLVIILGDRFEAVSAGLAMVPLRIPVAHISGGCLTKGAIDDVFRHCLTKIAAVHFCDLPEFARRIQLMGEAPDRIYTTGALGLDAILSAPRPSFAAFTDKFGLEGLQPGYWLVSLHPETQNPAETEPMAKAVVQALADIGGHVVATLPNADPGADHILDVFTDAARSNKWHLVPSFGADWYPAAMRFAQGMVGNSSGGIIEAASFQLGVVNVGDRQSGRCHGPNVVHSSRCARDIVAALEKITSPDFAPRRVAPNIYGDGDAASRILAALRSQPINSLAGPKPFAEPDPSFYGERTADQCA